MKKGHFFKKVKNGPFPNENKNLFTRMGYFFTKMAHFINKL